MATGVMDLIRRGVLFNKKLQPVYRDCTTLKYTDTLRIPMQEDCQSAIISQLFPQHYSLRVKLIFVSEEKSV